MTAPVAARAEHRQTKSCDDKQRFEFPRPHIPIIRSGSQYVMTGASAEAQLTDQPALIELSVIVPARNEEDCLGPCLESLVSQSTEFFSLGRDWEIIVVDD